MKVKFERKNDINGQLKKDYPKPEPLPMDLELSFFDKLRHTFSQEYRLFKLIINLYRSIKMSKSIDNKTTKYAWVAVALTLINTILGFFGLGLSPELLSTLQTVVTGAIGLIVGIIAYYTGKEDKDDE